MNMDGIGSGGYRKAPVSRGKGDVEDEGDGDGEGEKMEV